MITMMAGEAKDRDKCMVADGDLVIKVMAMLGKISCIRRASWWLESMQKS